MLRRARFLAVAARTANALTRAADVVLPAASLAEKEGTFTNVQGRVQRFERAFLPKPPVRAHWELLLLLGRRARLGRPRTGRRRTSSSRSRAEVPGYGGVEREAELEGGGLLKKGDFAWAGQPVTCGRLGHPRPAGRPSGADPAGRS